MRVPGNIRITKGDIDRVGSNRGSIYSKSGLVAGTLVDSQPEVVPPEFPTGLPMKSQREQRLLAAFFRLRGDEYALPIDYGRTGPPARQFHRPLDLFSLIPLSGHVCAVRHAVASKSSPLRPSGARCNGYIGAS